MLDGNVLTDARGHFAVLEASDRDWTLVRAARLTERQGTGGFRVGRVGVDAGTQVSRDDVADFIVEQVTDDHYLRALPFVSARARA